MAPCCAGFRVPPASRSRDTAAGVLAHFGPGERVRHPRGGSSPPARNPAFYGVGRGAVSGRVPKSAFGTFFASSGASKYFCGLKPKAFA